MLLFVGADTLDRIGANCALGNGKKRSLNLMKTLVVYYSLTNNTKLIAEAVAAQLHADLLEVKPQKKLPREGFWKFFLGGMSAIFKQSPKLENAAVDLSGYKNIIIGTPIWAGSFSAPIHSFLRRNRLAEKKIALFACHASKEANAAEKCFAGLKKELTGNTFVGEMDFCDPLVHAKEESTAKAAEWAAGLNF